MGKSLKRLAVHCLLISLFQALFLAPTAAEARCAAVLEEDEAKAFFARVMAGRKDAPESVKSFANPTGAKQFPRFRANEIKHEDWNGSIRLYFSSFAEMGASDPKDGIGELAPVVQFDKSLTFARLEGDHLKAPTSALSCLVDTGDLIYLSDGFTDHVAMIATVSRDTDQVTILDNWAKQSFLLAGNNVLGIEGRAWDEGDARYLALSLSQLEKVTQAITINAQLGLASFEKRVQILRNLFPLVPVCDLYYWLKVREMAIADGDRLVLNMIQITPAVKACGGAAVQSLSEASFFLGAIERGGIEARQVELGAIQFVEKLPWYSNFRLALRMQKENFFNSEVMLLRALQARAPMDSEIALQLAQACISLGDRKCAKDQLLAESNRINSDLERLFDEPSLEERIRDLFKNAPLTHTVNLLRIRIRRLAALSNEVDGTLPSGLGASVIPRLEYDQVANSTADLFAYVDGLDPNGDGFLALRSGVTRDATRIAQMPNGTLLKVFDFQAPWVHVSMLDGKTGWANSGWISCCRRTSSTEIRAAGNLGPWQIAESCDGIWWMRNRIWKRYGYCFSSTKALSVFGNSGCSRNEDAARTAMLPNDRDLIQRLAFREQELTCQR